jgi:Tc toxin complex TcA C-terminal TcB-binding domain
MSEAIKERGAGLGSGPADYRDYLRSVWVRMTSEPFVTPAPLPEAQAIDLLNARFHQDFRTSDTTGQPTNKLLIAVVTAALTAPAGPGFGFGVAPGSISPQGGMTDRGYLDYLISLSGVPSHELGLRYRLDLTQPDSAVASPVDLNVGTLLGFFRDGFQGPAEPVPVIPKEYLDHAPFFLEYEEWLAAQEPFYGENFYQYKQPFTMYLSDTDRGALPGWVKADPQKWTWVADVFALYDEMRAGAGMYLAREYRAALDHYRAAADIAAKIRYELDPADFAAIKAWFGTRKGKAVNNLADLDDLTGFGCGPVPDSGDPGHPNDPWGTWYDNYKDSLQHGAIFCRQIAIPLAIGDCLLALGDYPRAAEAFGTLTRVFAGHGSVTDQAGYPPIVEYAGGPGINNYVDGDLAYTVERHRDDPWFGTLSFYLSNYVNEYPDELHDVDAVEWTHEGHAHPTENAVFRLRQADAFLEWADTLYRTGDKAKIERARELYKGVSFLHGEDPPVIPGWGRVVIPPPVPLSENPAVTGQKMRARLGFAQIQAGLNFYGYAGNIVPWLRYAPLKNAADRLAAAAKSAQQDLLTYLGRIEQAIIDQIQTTGLLQRAQIQAAIAQQQAGIAADDIVVAQAQVGAVNQLITGKEQEIADHDSFFGQLSDYISGVISAVSPVPQAYDSYTKVFVGSDYKALIEESGLSGAGVIMAGYGAFIYASTVSLSSMAAAQNQRQDDLSTLLQRTLPAAQAQLDSKQRELSIAALAGAAAQADAQLAAQLLFFQHDRVLNLEFWASLATLASRLLRRYLDLGARYAWFAERALAYEQDRDVQIIRFDYFSAGDQGASGADLLLSDLAELEATRLDAITSTVPIQHTYSLARDFPLAFGQLRKTGRCVFRTAIAPVRQAHPGTYEHRIRAITVAASSATPIPPVRGLLSNDGISLLARLAADGTVQAGVSLRPPDAQPVSEFRLRSDMTVYGLPDEALLSFEGSGVETFWTLELPAAVNGSDLDRLNDILLTADMRARYSPVLHAADIAAKPKNIQRFVMFSGLALDPAGVGALIQGSPLAKIAFPLTKAGLPSGEKNRQVTNIVLFLTGGPKLNFTANLAVTQPALSRKAEFVNSQTLSTLPPITDPQSSVPASPLNDFKGVNVDQTFTLSLNVSPVKTDFSAVFDAILGIEYTADLSP